jgi:small conductance mechanosensitive channel
MSEEKSSRLDLHKWIVLSIIIVFILLGSFSNMLFPGSTFASIVDSSIGKFFNLFDLIKNNYINILESIAIILFIGILYYILSVLIALVTKKNSRGDTIGILITSMLRFGAMVLALIMVLSAWNVPTPTLLAGAGIAGLAVSFGAQGLLEDVFAGLSIIFEKQFVVGDFVEVDGFKGTVQEIGPRNTRIKSIYGNVLIIANSDIREIINFSDDLSFAVSEISIEYSEDLDKVEKILLENLPNIGKKDERILSGPKYDGVDQLADSSVVVRVIAHCEEKNRIDITRFLNKELKMLFDRNNIQIPFPQLVIHNKSTESESK